MPEGPSLLRLKDKLLAFKNKQVKNAGGYSKMPTDWINGKKLLDIQTWGKHLFFIFTNGAVNLHLGLFGEVLVNERKKVNRSFFLEFATGEINGYVVRVKKEKKELEDLYDWRTDILSKQYDKRYVKKLLKEKGNKKIEEVLMDQKIFTGVGNIIRNEALYRASIHPLSVVEKIPAEKISKLINEVLAYAKLFYKNLNKKGVNKDFYVYKKDFAEDGSEVSMLVLQKTKRKIYFSEHKQKLYK